MLQFLPHCFIYAAILLHLAEGGERPSRINNKMVLSTFLQKTGKVTTLHGVKSGNAKLLDSKRILIPDFSFDGTAPALYFFVGRYPIPDEFPREYPGNPIPNENGSCAPLHLYKKKSIILTLPGDLTFNEVDWIGLYCKDFNHIFGFIEIPKSHRGSLLESGRSFSPSRNVCQKCTTTISARLLKSLGYYLPSCTEAN